MLLLILLILCDYLYIYLSQSLKCGLFSFRQLEVHLLEKIKLNCQVFKEEITIVHLNRQATHLLNAWQGSSMKVQQIKLVSFIECLHHCRV